MATLVEIVRFYVAREAASIHTLKAEAVVWQTSEAYAYVAPDGRVSVARPEDRDDPAAGWEYKKVELRKQVGHLSPASATWPAYRRAKRRASLMLTARHLLKLGDGLGDGAVPTADAVRVARGDGRLTHHAGRGRHAASHVASAYRALRKLANRAERAPERFADVDAWAAARHADAESGGR